MAGNSFGTRWIITTFGESHGNGLGVIIDGCPAGVTFDFDLLSEELVKRRPGADKKVVSDRNEGDLPKVLSGVFEGKTLGTPISIMVENMDQRSGDYKDVGFRVGHADDVWQEKFGHRDPRGGGRSSGRETVARVMGGAVAKMYLQEVCPDLKVHGGVTQIGPIMWDWSDEENALSGLRNETIINSSWSRMPVEQLNKEAEALLFAAKEKGKSYGGEVTLVMDDVPKGLGQPVFNKLKSDLAGAFMSIGAAYSVELGAPIDLGAAEGSLFHGRKQADIYGGIRGGISTGDPVIIRIKFKPTSSVLHVAKKGRHDPCIVPRALHVAINMAYLVLADHYLMTLGEKL